MAATNLSHSTRRVDPARVRAAILATFAIAAVAVAVTTPLPAFAATAPDAPTGVVATAGDARAAVSWTAPASDGGSAITEYVITATNTAVPAETHTATVSPSNGAQTVTGLTDGQTYTLTVTAENSVGLGSPSAASAAVTPADGAFDSIDGVITTIPYAGPAYFTPTGTRAYLFGSSVNLVNTSSLALVDTGTGEGTPLGVSPDVTRAYVAQPVGGGDGSNTAVYDLATFSELTDFNQGGINTRLAIMSSDGSLIAYQNRGNGPDAGQFGGYALANADNYTPITAVRNDNLQGIGLSADASRLWFNTNAGTNNLYYEDLATSTFSTQLTVTGIPTAPMFTTPDGSLLFFTTSAGVTVIDTTTLTIVGTIAVTSPGQPVLSPDDKSLVIPHGNTVSIYDITDGTLPLVRNIAVSAGAVSVAVTPDGKQIWANNGTDTTSILGVLTFPGKPTAVTGTPGDAQVDLSWSAPADHGNTAITGYTVYIYDETTSTSTSVNSASTSTNLTGLINGHNYHFTVTATNGAGEGPASDPSGTVTPSAVPDPPTGVTATAGNARARVSWIAPTDDGGTVVQSYIVTAHDVTTGTTGPTVSIADPSATSTTVTGLVNGDVYDFTVVAVNSAGDSLDSALSNDVTPTAPVVLSTPGLAYTGSAFDPIVAGAGILALLLAGAALLVTTRRRRAANSHKA